jgi:Flp pilus assembly protein TadD
VSAGASAGHPTTIRAGLLFAVLASLVYANSLGNGFVFDDTMLIAQAREVASPSQFLRRFEAELRSPGARSTDQGISHRPVRNAALAVQYSLFGEAPQGYRAVNVLLHVLNSVLVFALLTALVGRRWPALYAALLFVVHPVHTESVAYVAGQRDVLFTVLYLSGFFSYVRYRETDRTIFLGLAGLAYLLGLLTKEMAITLPVICLAYDVFRLMPGATSAVAPPAGNAVRQGWRAAVERSKWLYLGMGAILVFLLLYFVVIANPSQQRRLYGGGLGPTLLTSARIFVHYLKQMVVPLTLNADSYSAFQITRSLTDPRGWLALLLLGGVWYGLLRGLRADRWFTFGGLWFFATLLPVSQLVPHQELVAEHFLYLPSVGFSLAVGLLIERGLTLPRAGRAVGAVVVIALLLLGVRTVLRNRDWKDDLTLWTKSAQDAPHSYWAHQRLGDAYKARGRYAEAIQAYKTVQALTPGFATEYIAIGDCYRRMGDYEAAVDQFQRALMIAPNSVAGRLGLVHAYLAMGLAGKAREVHEPIAPFLAKAARDLLEAGNARMAQGFASEAVMAYRDGLELDPFDPSLHLGLAGAYTALGLHAEAAEAYRKAREIDPAYGDGARQFIRSERQVAARTGLIR